MTQPRAALELRRDEELRRCCSGLIEDRFGLCLSAEQSATLERLMTKAAQESGVASPWKLFQALVDGQSPALLEGLVTQLTVGETHFFRIGPQIEALRSIERAAQGEDIGPLINESVDEWNHRRVEERRRLPLVDVMQEFNEAHDQLLAALEQWPEDRVPLGPEGWDEDCQLWWLTDHDREHLDVIQAYRQRMAAV